jgi:cysteine desulfurase
MNHYTRGAYEFRVVLDSESGRCRNPDTMQRSVYFDSNASHPLLPSVKKSLADALLAEEDLVNPSSVHRPGQKAKRILTELREELCKYLGRSDSDEFVYMSGATEAINLMMRSFVQVKLSEGRVPVLAISKVEHSAVIDTARDLAEAYQLQLVNFDVDSRGQLDTLKLIETFRVILEANPQVDILWIAQATNNETGVCYNFREILPAIHTHFAPKLLLDKPRIKNKFQKTSQRIWIGIDCAQALGKLDDSEIRFALHFADYAAFSAHKFGGPMGIGALWHRPESPIKIQMTGGVQERRRRAGTHNILGLLGFLVALREWSEKGQEWRAHMAHLRNIAYQELQKIPGFRLHGCQVDSELPGLSNTLNFHFDGCPEESLLLSMDLAGFALSSGSACNSGSLRPSHVLKAMGFSTEEALSSLRFCLGVQNTEQEVRAFVKTLREKIQQIRDARKQSQEFLEDLVIPETNDIRVTLS